MKNLSAIFILFMLVFMMSCEQSSSTENQAAKDNPASQPSPYTDISDLNATDTLYRIQSGEGMGMDLPCGYVNQKGDTIIPMKYSFCFLETVTTYALVADMGKTADEIYAIDREQNRLFEAYWFDNGPDYESDGLFRFKRNGKIGYARPNGEIVIEAQFACAGQFEEGKARVSLDCELKKEGENTLMESDDWFYIDKSGEKVE